MGCMIKNVWNHHHPQTISQSWRQLQVLVQPQTKGHGRIPGNPPPRPHWPTGQQHSLGHLSYHLPTASGPHGLLRPLPPWGLPLLWAPIGEAPFDQKNTGPHQGTHFLSRIVDLDPQGLFYFRSIHSIQGWAMLKTLESWSFLDLLSEMHLLSLARHNLLLKRENMNFIFK